MKSTVISRYLLREAGVSMLAVSAVLLGVMYTNSLVRLLGQAANDDLPPSGVMNLLGLATISHTGFLLPAGILLGIVLAFGRLYRDSEMPALAACGVGPWQLFRALLWLAIPTALFVAWLSLLAAPWALRTTASVQAALQQSLGLERIGAGRLLTSERADGMLYVEAMDADGAMQDVFLQTRRDGETVLVTAETARRRTDPATGDDFLVLKNGYRFEGVPGELRWRTLRFEEHGVRLARGSVSAASISRGGVPLGTLLASGKLLHVAELQWRLSAPLMVLILTLLAVPMSRTEPREGRYGKVLTAVLVFVVYFSLLSTSAESVKNGQLSPWIGVWWVHGLMLVLGLLWLHRSFGVLRRSRL